MNKTDPQPSSSNHRAQIAAGILTSAGGFALSYAAPRSPELGQVFPYIIAITILPLAATIFSIIRATRRFGLGMLLGCGVIWLIMLAICGGLFR